MKKEHSPIIYELEGLRGLLALWVFIFHACRFCGITTFLIPNGGFAVNVFMILSGFVISRLLISKPEPYLPYLARRAARIYPAYLIALMSGIVISGLISSVYAEIPWPQEDITREVIRHTIEMQKFIPLVTVHLALLHGIFPEEILKTSSLAFVGPAWSLSLEWQFYLIAPFLVALIISRRWQTIAIAGVILIAILTPRLLMNFTYVVPSFFPASIAFFGVGIVSALLYDHIRQARKEFLIYGGFGIICALLSCIGLWSHNDIPFVIWIIALLSAMEPENIGLKMVSKFLTCAPVKFMGRISYGFYVYHTTVYICVASLLFSIGVHEKIVMLAGILLISLPVTFSLAALSYHFIELPVMRYAKKRLA
jgi:peptidoglycan/LPS O-acetylase OafA/YrhL